MIQTPKQNSNAIAMSNSYSAWGILTMVSLLVVAFSFVGEAFTLQVLNSNIPQLDLVLRNITVTTVLLVGITAIIRKHISMVYQFVLLFAICGTIVVKFYSQFYHQTDFAVATGLLLYAWFMVDVWMKEMEVFDNRLLIKRMSTVIALIAAGVYGLLSYLGQFNYFQTAIFGVSGALIGLVALLVTHNEFKVLRINALEINQHNSIWAVVKSKLNRWIIAATTIGIVLFFATFFKLFHLLQMVIVERFQYVLELHSKELLLYGGVGTAVNFFLFNLIRSRLSLNWQINLYPMGVLLFIGAGLATYFYNPTLNQNFLYYTLSTIGFGICQWLFHSFW